MQTQITIAKIIDMARELSPLDKLKLIEQLAPELAAALSGASESKSAAELYSRYEQAYTNAPEQIGDIEALLPHLPLPTERWE